MERTIPKIVTVRRSKLLCGGKKPAVLLNKDGEKCIAGWIAIACRIPARVILEASTPGEIPYPFVRRMDGLVKEVGDKEYDHTGIADELMTTNDNTSYSQEDREAKLNEIAADLDFQFRFIP